MSHDNIKIDEKVYSEVFQSFSKTTKFLGLKNYSSK